MALYRYKAVTTDGELLQGEMEGSDQAAIIAQIQSSGYIPIRATPVGVQHFGFPFQRKLLYPRRIARRELAVFTQELSSLLHAGLPLDRALQIMIDVADDNHVRSLTSSIQEAVRGGAAFSDALETHKGIFSRFYVNMVRASEAGGTLDLGLARLVEYLERARALKESVLSALIYPSILVTVSGVSLLIILTYVVPQFTQLFAEAGRALPLSTQVVVNTAALLRDYWWLLVLAVMTLALYVRWQLATPWGRYRWDRLLLRLPMVGELIKRMDMARFSRSLGTLLASGIPLLAGLSIVKDILSNRVLSDTLDVAADTLKAGRSLAEQLMSTGLFPALGLQMIKVGEETGRLDEMLLRVADIYDREVTTAIQRMLALLEPILIVGLGLLIAGIIMSILVAIVSVNELPL
ncbi:MAG: type II secretion system F family protein [Gammaproteobacteria bacterium]|nr:type II secretion system F family protein [Gammaproteobacteria bacterium]